MGSSRVIVIVPRHEVKLHTYLQRSLACLVDVEVVLDRRAASARPPDERRRPSPESSERRLLLCSLVHCPVPSSTPDPRVEAGTDSRRTLLWPGLRLDQL